MWGVFLLERNYLKIYKYRLMSYWDVVPGGKGHIDWLEVKKFKDKNQHPDKQA